MGYTYKKHLKTVEREQVFSNHNDYSCKLPRVHINDVTRKMLMEAREPMLIEGVVENWDAVKRWKKEALLQSRENDVFAVNATSTFMLKTVLTSERRYHVGLVQRNGECYNDGEKCISEWSYMNCLSPNFYERLYSPFVADTIEKDVNIPESLTPLKVMQIGVGTGVGTGVVPEEHPRSWWANVIGTKRWVLHPPTLNPPSSVFTERALGCNVRYIHSDTQFCDQPAQTIMWLPDGWWHETCNVEEYTIGAGALSNEFADAQIEKNTCGVKNIDMHKNFTLEDSKEDPKARDYVATNKIMFQDTEEYREYSISDIAYCKDHRCLTLEKIL
jgi:hypothetical protein